MQDSVCGDIRRRKNSGMLKRLWKKVKGSHNGDPANEDWEDSSHQSLKEGHTETEGSPVSDPECQSQGSFASAHARSQVRTQQSPKSRWSRFSRQGRDVAEVDDDASVSSVSSGGSTSSNEAYYSMVENEIITAPARRHSEQTSSHRRSVMLLGNTQFPEFEWENPPEGELTDGSDDESIVRKKEEAYATKEDQDVAVFTAIANRLAMKSLLHLLQGLRAEQNLPSSSYLKIYGDALTEEAKCAERSSSSSSNGSAPTEKKPLVRKKHFRWAEVTDAKVRVVVHEIRSVKAHKEMWWSTAEMNSIRKELIDVVQFFRRRRPHYITSVEHVARGNEDETIVEEHMKQLLSDSFPRGLETHIVKMLSDHRRSTIQAVLDEQRECKSSNDSPECMSHCIREQSLAYSQMSSRFAVNMAKCDQIDALKAGMTRWRAYPTSSGTFFAR